MGGEIVAGTKYGTFSSIYSEMNELSKKDGNRLGSIINGKGTAVYNKKNEALCLKFIIDSNNDGKYDTFSYYSKSGHYEGSLLDPDKKVHTITSGNVRAVDKNNNGIVDENEIEKLR